MGIIGREKDDVRISSDARILEIHMVQLFLLYINPVTFSSQRNSRHPNEFSGLLFFPLCSRLLSAESFDYYACF